ncbi:metal-dependent hydrolase [Synergistaceae bacterium OttesenSCG-928-I11]|nr:metal-dependent hydrolase [Synergistaceae bacterium OttesenSCG-928-I11]
MPTKFTYYGGMCVMIERSDGYKILVDPFLSNNPATTVSVDDMSNVDLLLVTHAAYDHYGDTAQIMKKGKAFIVAGTEVLRKAEKELGYEIDADRKGGTIYGDERCFGETIVRTVIAHHGSNTIENGGVAACYMPFGFIVHVERGMTYYHTGDTSIFGDMRMLRELYRPNVMCVGIAGITEAFPCEMTPREAAMATMWVGPEVVIPTHYPPGSPALGEFTQHVKSFAPETIVRQEVGKTFVCTPFSVM